MKRGFPVQVRASHTHLLPPSFSHLIFEFLGVLGALAANYRFSLLCSYRRSSVFIGG